MSWKRGEQGYGRWWPFHASLIPEPGITTMHDSDTRRAWRMGAVYASLSRAPHCLTWNGPMVAMSWGASPYWSGHREEGMTRKRPGPPRLWNRNCCTCGHRKHGAQRGCCKHTRQGYGCACEGTGKSCRRRHWGRVAMVAALHVEEA